MTAAGTVFDVSEVSTSDYRKGNRTFHLVGLAASIILGVGGIAAIAAVAIRGGLVDAPVSSLVVLGFAWGIVVVAAVVTLMFSPGATKVQVMSTGIQLTYQRGRTKEFLWNDPGVRLTLYEFPEILPSGRPFPFSRFWLATWHPQSNPLTPEAFNAILASADSAGLTIARSKSSIGTPRTVIRILGRATVT